MSTPTATAIITVQTREVLGEVVIFLGPDSLVAAKSRPGHYYIVTDGARCTCEGFTHRQTCRHLAAAREAAELDRRNATPAGDPDPTPAAPLATGVPGYLRGVMPSYTWGG